MPSVSISLAFGINWITLACTTSLKQNTGRDIHYERQTISEKSTARAPAEPFGGIGTCTIFDRHRDLPPSHFLYRFGLDNGIGIPQSDLPRVFEKGFTGQNGRTVHSSTGIGLYLCKRLCDKLGIGLSVCSQGNGTSVSLIFPINDFVAGVQG